MTRPATLAGLPIDLDDHDRLAEDVPCLGCGYDLRGLDTAGGCPECGGRIVEAVKAHVLRRDNGYWLESLASGSAWARLGFALAGVATLLLAAGLLSGRLGLAGASLLPGVLAVAQALGGVWAMTTPDESRRVPSAWPAVTRGAMTVALPVGVMALLFFCLFPPLSFVFIQGALWLGVVGVVGGFAYAARVARWLGAPLLALWLVLWCVVFAVDAVLVPAVAGGYVVQSQAAGVTPSPARFVAQMTPALIVAAALTLGLCTAAALLLGRYRRLLLETPRPRAGEGGRGGGERRSPTAG